MTIYKFVIHFSIFVFLINCKPVQKKTNSTPSTTNSELAGKLWKIDSTWSNMIESDDSKIENLNRLTKELQLINGGNEAALVEIQKKVSGLATYRYDRISLSKPNAIDRYDSATNVIISEIKREATANPNAIRYQIINQLLSEIQNADDSVLFYRKDYDRTIDVYNAFLKKNTRDLKRSYPEFDSLRTYPVFRYIQ